jgi:hypothetical protein
MRAGAGRVGIFMRQLLPGFESRENLPEELRLPGLFRYEQHEQRVQPLPVVRFCDYFAAQAFGQHQCAGRTLIGNSVHGFLLLHSRAARSARLAREPVTPAVVSPRAPSLAAVVFQYHEQLVFGHALVAERAYVRCQHGLGAALARALVLADPVRVLNHAGPPLMRAQLAS